MPGSLAQPVTSKAIMLADSTIAKTLPVVGSVAFHLISFRLWDIKSWLASGATVGGVSEVPGMHKARRPVMPPETEQKT